MNPNDVTRPSPNFYAGRLGAQIIGVTLHSTRGGTSDPAVEFSAALNWLSGHTYKGRDGRSHRNPSIHYIVGHDGRLATVVPERHGAWHAGTGSRRDGANLNAIGIELVQPTPQDAYPEPLLARTVDLVAAICRRHAIPALRVHTDTQPGIHHHSDLNPRKSDPGPRWPDADFLARIDARLASARDRPPAAADPSILRRLLQLQRTQTGHAADIDALRQGLAQTRTRLHAIGKAALAD